MVRHRGVQLCSVVYAAHPTVLADHPDRVSVEGVDVEVVTQHGAVWHKRLGVGVLAVFRSASKAVSAAEALQQRAAALHPEHAPAIGVSTGEALVDDDPLGMMVVVAARLSGAAAAGEVLVCDATAALADTIVAGRCELDQWTDRELKGLPTAVRSGALQWVTPPSIAEAWGVAAEARLDSPFAGRDTEVDALRAAVARCAEGAGSVVVVSGEAGAGKSALVAQLVDAAAMAGRPLLYGRCDEHVPRPYLPFAQMVRRVGERDPRGSAALGTFAGELRRAVPELGEWFPLLPEPMRADADSERMRLLESFAAWCTATASVGAVMVVDDLQWADAGSLDVVRAAAAVAQQHALLVVVASRPAQGAAHDLLVDLRRDGALDLRLEGLTVDDIASLVPAETPREVVADIHRRTAGNPFFVRELVRVVREGEAAAGDEEVRSVVMRRIGVLSEATRKLLSAASVMGLTFDAMVLVDIGATDDESVLDCLEEAVAAGVVVERVEGMRITHEFVHALTRDALYGELSGLRRARLHQQLARALELRSAPAADLARHFTAAVAVGETEAALRYTLAAAHEAFEALGNEQALLGYRQAAELLAMLPAAEPGRRIDVDVRIGECLLRIGHADYLPVLLAAADAASELGDGLRMAAALSATYRGSFHQAFFVNTDLIARLERALVLVPPSEFSVRASLLARLAVELAWSDQLVRARALSDEAIALVERLLADGGEPSVVEPLLARVLILRQWTLHESLDERTEWQRVVDEITTRYRDPGLRFEACDMAYFNAERSGDGPAAQAAFDEAMALAEQLGSPIVWWNATRLQSTAAARRGRGDDRVAAIEHAYSVGKAAMQPDTALRRAGEMFWVDFEHGEVAAQVDAMNALWRLGMAQPFGLAVSFAHRCLEVGLTDLANDLYQSVRPLVASPLHHHTWLAVQTQLAYVSSSLGHLDDALELQAALVPYREQVANMWFTGLGSVARYVAHTRLVDGDVDGAITDLQYALEANERVGAVTWRARTALDLAELLRRRADAGDAAQANELIAAAALVAERHNLPVVAARAQRLLASR